MLKKSLLAIITFQLLSFHVLSDESLDEQRNKLIICIYSKKHGNTDANLLKLLKSNMDLNFIEKGYRQLTPLIYAAEAEKIGTLKILLDAGAKIDFRDNYKQTALFYAVETGNLSIVKFLLEKGAKLNLKDEVGETPFFIGAQKGHYDVLKLLIKHGAKINAISLFKETALDSVIRQKRILKQEVKNHPHMYSNFGIDHIKKYDKMISFLKKCGVKKAKELPKSKKTK